jgi:hypothetical protein
MAGVRNVTSIKFFAVNSDLTYFEGDSLEKVSSAGSKWIIKQQIGNNPFTANSGQTWGNFASIMEFVDKEGNIQNYIEENGWKFGFSRFGMRGGYGYTDMWIEFIDKIGLSNSQESFDISIDGFLTAYKRFRQLNVYDGYKYGSLAVENTSLKQQISEATKKVGFLEAENTRLKNLLSSIS